MTTKEKLQSIANNLWWSWQPQAIGLFEELNREAFRSNSNNPYIALHYATDNILNDDSFVNRVDVVYQELGRYLAESPSSDDPSVGYMCMEFGLHESIPFYSGGLGILAGDHLKASSDANINMVAVGLLLRDGYFQQYVDRGIQTAEYPGFDTRRHPTFLVRDESGAPLTVEVHLGRSPLKLRVWRMDVGRVKLYLLDSDFEANPIEHRFLTRRLYAGHRRTRIRQEIVLGVGGIRALRAIGHSPAVFHLNEGHCAFATYELLREASGRGLDRHNAEEDVRAKCLFTTHTPVKAGHDRFHAGLFLDQMIVLREQLHMSEYDILSYGRVNPNDDSEDFTMTVLGLKLTGKANGVSKLNGAVARAQWHQMYPGQHVDDVPIGHVTNGIHVPTWRSATPAPLVVSNSDTGELSRRSYQLRTQVSDAELWRYRCDLRRRLIDYARTHVARHSVAQRFSLDYDALTIGFARRFATYKRATLLFHDLERAGRLFADSNRPIQVIYAGKAHPQDEHGKNLIRRLVELLSIAPFSGKLVFLENYNMEVGRMLISGCDVWLNNPRRPYEASGTSGQKTAVHGGLNLSVLDGWWPEGFDGTNGWSIGTDSSSEMKNPSIQDPEDARLLYDVLEQSVIREFYDRNTDGIPLEWTERMRRAIESLVNEFSAARMIDDYRMNYYRPIAQPVTA